MNHPAIIDDSELEPELAHEFRDLWTDEMVPNLLDSPSHLLLAENAAL